MSSLRAKRSRRITEVVASRDRISALPDDLLIKILSLVSTKDAVATMILSKRWRFVWTMVSKLEYKDTDDEPERVCRYLDKSLKLHKAPVLETLCIQLRKDCPSYIGVNFRKWIAYAVDRYVRVLKFDLLGYSKLTTLPTSLYTCKTLVELTLSGKILVDVPSSACLPSLKKLLLVFLVYKDEDSLVRLLSSCSVLARSTIRLYVSDNWRDNISIKKNVPCIRVFCYDDDEFLSSLPLVTSLTLSLADPMAVNFSGITFCRLQRFKMRTLKLSNGWSNLLLQILNNSPTLQSLYIHSRYGYNPLSWKQPRLIPSCLSSHLEVFEWKKYRGRSDEKRLVRYILANSKCLKKATITLKPRVEKKIVNELASMSRVSTMSQLLIN